MAVLVALLLAAGHAAGTTPAGATPPDGGPAPATPTPAPSRAGSVHTVSVDATPSGRYYVVGPPVAGQREYLYQIAARTLGDGNRYREIFELNRGRRQSDGGRLTDPAELRPGWVLALPLDARGPGVRTGPLPSAGGDPTAPPASAGPGHTGQLVVLAGLAAVALLVATLLRRPPRRRRALPGRPVPLALAAGDVVPVPPHLTVEVDPSVEAPCGGAAVVTPTPPDPARRPTPVPRPDPAAQPDPGTPPDPAAQPDPMAPPDPAAQPDRAAPTGPGDSPDTPDGPPPTADGDLDTEVTSPAGTLAVRVPGVVPGGGQPHHAWRIPAQPRPAMRLPVRLGHRRGWALWVDLAGTPDVFTVTGPVEAARRRARTIAEQVHAAGHTVTVVGDLFGPDLPAGWTRRATFPTDEADLPDGTGVLCSAALAGPDLAFARRIATLTGHRLVPIVVGRALRARWSVTVRPTDTSTAAPVAVASGGRPGDGVGFPGDGGRQ
ncbi:hypothetical protein ABZ436_21155 [Micromonospora matsumotoense]|uniref:hypothetical protein n=1 Tax=Micromonospora matsumotoense TaxID=121616 RepID=UPI00340063F1